MKAIDLEQYLKNSAQRINDYLTNWITSYTSTLEDLEIKPRLLEAIVYSIQNGGKRLRPCLVYMMGEALGASKDVLDAPAAAVELIHCYSLIHDDLPAMDNDEWRRGQLTCHKAFDEATAILAGDALQTLAFELLSDPQQNPSSEKMQIEMVRTLARASGPQGMISGQALDMAAENRSISLETLQKIHQQKTGALMIASVQLAAIAAHCHDGATLSALKRYADQIGLAYQLQDDLLDIEGTLDRLGKNPGQDKASNKATFPALLGLESTKQYARELYQEAIHTLDKIFELKDYFPLKQLSEFLVYRTY